ncbi:MAG: hypothetical protein LQ348_003780 [Seirophora lacunosa]|nr:MAG: hypothetical protein LQ348_003780 [Seirophora lacunosa]
MAEVSSTRLYLGNLPRDGSFRVLAGPCQITTPPLVRPQQAREILEQFKWPLILLSDSADHDPSQLAVTKEDIQTHFKEARGTIAEVKLMNGFGFIEYQDAMDARDVVPDGSDLNGSRLTVQFARGSRQRNEFAGPPERPHPRPRRTAHRMQITGLPGETSWQDLKDFARRSGLDVVYSEVGRDRDGKGFVEFETAADLKVAVEKLDDNDFKGATVRCTADPQDEVPRNERYGRSRSPPPGRRAYPPDGYYDRGPPPPRDYPPRDRDAYRRRSPPRHYEDYPRHDRGYRSPPPVRPGRGPPDELYPPARGGYERDPYAAPPPRRPYDDDYGVNGYGRPRERSPPPRGYGGYERPRYW